MSIKAAMKKQIEEHRTLIGVLENRIDYAIDNGRPTAELSTRIEKHAKCLRGMEKIYAKMEAASC